MIINIDDDNLKWKITVFSMVKRLLSVTEVSCLWILNNHVIISNKWIGKLELNTPNI